MAIRVSCPNPGCGAVASVEEQSLGKRGRCKKCGYVFALARPDGQSMPGVSEDASAWKKGSAEAASPTKLPELFGRYRIVKQLGQGGMGAVYLAHDTKLEREVALKVPYFHPADGPEAVQRFEREARAAATLDHPNLCPIHDVGEFDGIHYLTMPYIQGKPLSDVLGRDQPMTESQAAAIVLKLAQALQEAHEKGVIHRDLKPSNIMINRRRELIVMDFGLASLAAEGNKTLTRTGNVLGTALYMAPEQAAGDLAAVGPQADIYSLGVILYELLTGRTPFEGPWGLVIGLKNVKDPDPPSKHRPDLSPTLDAICHQAIAKEPKDRYPTMSEFAASLEAFLKAGSPPVSSAIAGEPIDRRTPKRSSPSFARKSILIAVSLACLALIVILRLRQRPEKIAEVSPPETVKAAPPETVKPVEVEKPTMATNPPAYNLKAFKVLTGEWSIVGDELHQNSMIAWWSGITFGNARWKDYDFTLDLMRVKGGNGCMMTFRQMDLQNYASFNFSFPVSPPTALFTFDQGQFHEVNNDPKFQLIENQWYTARVSVRGGRMTCTLDDGEKEVLRLSGATGDHSKGCVGLATWGSVYRFKNIQVTADDGQILWKGLPEIGPGGGKEGDGMGPESP